MYYVIGLLAFVLVIGIIIVTAPKERVAKPKALQPAEDNADLVVEVLGTDSDGYTIKRFRESRREYYKYYVTGPGNSRVDQEVRYGKNSTRVESVQTVKQPSPF